MTRTNARVWILIRQKDRRRAIGFLRRRAVCDTDDDERRDDDEMGTFFDARTRIAHFRFEAHARENRATDDASSTHQHRMCPSSACRASLLAFTRVVRATSKKIHARASSVTTTTSPRRARSFSSSSRNEKMRIEKETPPNSRLSRLRLADSTFCDRTIDRRRRRRRYRGCARARRGVVRSPRARATTEDERDARRTEEEDIVISSGDDDDVAIRVRDGTGVLLNFSNKQTPRV